MSLRGQCPRCRAHLDVAVAVVLADPDISGRIVAAKGNTPNSVVSAGPSTGAESASRGITTVTVKDGSLEGDRAGAGAPERGEDEVP